LLDSNVSNPGPLNYHGSMDVLVSCGTLPVLPGTHAHVNRPTLSTAALTGH